MRLLQILLFALLCVFLPMQVMAQSNTAVESVWTVSAEGDSEAWLNAVRPLMARYKELRPEMQYNIYRSEFSGPGYGQLILVVRSPSMAYMEETSRKTEGDKKLEELWPAVIAAGKSVVSRVLLSDVTN